MRASFALRLLLTRLRWLAFLAATALGMFVFQMPAQVLGPYAWILMVAWGLMVWGSNRLVREHLRVGEAPPAVNLGIDAGGEISLRAVPGRDGLLAPLFRLALAPRLVLGERGLVLCDRRGQRVIEYAHIARVDWSVDGIELTLMSGERMLLRTFSQPSSFLLSDPRVTALVRAAAFQAMAVNQRLAERVKSSLRGREGTAYRTAGRLRVADLAEASVGEPSPCDEGEPVRSELAGERGFRASR